MWKRILSTIILMLRVVHLAGFYVYFVIRLGDIRMDMRDQLAKLPAHQLHVITIPQDQFRISWMEEKEMKWQGNMYDIARVEQSGNVIRVHCLRDYDEDNLLSFLNSVVDMTRQDTQPVPASLMKFFSLKYVVAYTISTIALSTKDSPFTPYTDLGKELITQYPPTPPPRA